MAEFKKNNRFTHSARKPFSGGSRPPFRGGTGGGRDFGGDREMFDAECANCHTKTQVPFRPNGQKPVFCRDCFKPEGAGAPQRFPNRDAGPRREFSPRPAQSDSGMADVKRQLQTMNTTLERMVALLEKNERSAVLSEEMQKYREPKEVTKKPKAKVVAKKAKKGKK